MFLDPALTVFGAQNYGPPLRERFLDLPGVRLHIVEAGPADGKPVLLLHGFPEFWWGWRHQIRHSRRPAGGWSLRTCGATTSPGSPGGICSYGLEALTDDLRGLLDDLGPDPIDLVAHDWGGAVAWWGALRFPQRIARLALLNIPHPGVMKRFLLHNREQRRRSRYIFYFQLPWLPERKIRAGGFRGYRAIFKRTSRPGTFTPEDLDTYARAAAQPGALTAMLNWYRAALWCPPRRPAHRLVEPPVRILWGEDDVALGSRWPGPRCPAVAPPSSR